MKERSLWLPIENLECHHFRDLYNIINANWHIIFLGPFSLGRYEVPSRKIFHKPSIVTFYKNCNALLQHTEEMEHTHKFKIMEFGITCGKWRSADHKRKFSLSCMTLFSNYEFCVCEEKEKVIVKIYKIDWALVL